jgi:prepilin-type N-terminal cleavage/methylation domain-containing protein
MRLPINSRRGYTLLELMLAMTIALIILAAVYAAIDTMFREMDEGRARVEQSTLARSLFQRMSADLTPSLGPVTPPTSGGSSGGAAAGGGGSSATTMTDTTTTQDSSTTASVVFSVGVKGESDHVSIFLTRMSRSIVYPPDTSTGTPPATSDVVRITYFLDSDKGLCREEILQASSDLVDQAPTAFIDGDDHYRIVAGEVKSFDVSYYDGTNWQSSWDGSTPGPDGKTPQGPPRCIEVTIGMQMPGSDTTQTFKHTISFPTAPGPSSQGTSGSSGSTGTMP